LCQKQVKKRCLAREGGKGAPEAGITAGLLKPAQAILALQIGGQG